MKVSTNHSDYNRNRNIIDLPFERVKVLKVVDIYKLITHFYFKTFNISHYYFLNSFNDFELNGSEIVHLFNGISYSNTPWISTFEYTLPRYSNSSKAKYKKGVERLTHSSCKYLLALSENAKKLQVDYLEENYPEYLTIISDKIQVLHPQQKHLINNYGEKKLSNDKIVFTIIGADFFRKGGLEVLRVFDKLHKEKITLNIVSTLQYGDYASKAGIKELEEATKLISENLNINYFKTLPNNKVLELLKNSHIGLLPTYGDTYGYSLLEAQASGCPVISTDVSSLPEINNNEIGWIINVPKDKNRNGVLSSHKDISKFSSIVEKELYRIIKDDILSKHSIIKEKGVKALERISKEHNPKDKAEFLEEIYSEAIRN